MAGMVMQLNTGNLVRGLDNMKAAMPAAIARALNRAIVSARVVAARDTAADMGLKVSDVTNAMTVTQAYAPDHLVATLNADAKRIPLIKFGATGPQPSRGKGAGVTARTPTGSYPHAFIATMPTGHLGVFERINKTYGAGRYDRLPIRELMGPSIVHVARKHTDAALARGEEQLVKNLQSEFRYAIRGGLAA